jgi:hypothetical protein
MVISLIIQAVICTKYVKLPHDGTRWCLPVLSLVYSYFTFRTTERISVKLGIAIYAKFYETNFLLVLIGPQLLLFYSKLKSNIVKICPWFKTWLNSKNIDIINMYI